MSVSVVIFTEMCMLYAKGLKYTIPGATTVSSKCRNHRDCINRLGCPGVYLDEGKVQIDTAQCTGCAVCAQICPENAILPVKDE